MTLLYLVVSILNVCFFLMVGHYDCGAVRAANKRQDLGLLENWLRLIRDVYRLHKDYIDLISVSSAALIEQLSS